MKKMALICLCTMTTSSLLANCSNNTGSRNEDLGSVGLGEYKGVKANTPSVIVTGVEVEPRTNQVLSQNPSEEELDRPTQEGDVVNIDCVGEQDGVELTGDTDTGYDLTLGSGRFIEGFENGLIGTKKGDKGELNLTFPETYPEETLAGKPVVFRVTTNVVREKKDAVLDDVFVQRVSGYRTVDKHKESIRTDLLKQKQQPVGLQVQQSVLQQVVESSTFKLNKIALPRRYNIRIRQYEGRVKMYGSSLSHVAQANGMDVPGFQEAIYASVKDDVRNQLVINTAAEHEGIMPKDADHQAFAESNGQDVEDTVVYYGQETSDEMALNYKVMKLMADNALSVAEATETKTPAAETTAGATAIEEIAATK